MRKYSKYKPSGVEWIGDIPEKWELIKVGYLGNLLTGYPWKSELFDFEDGIKIVRGENVSEGFFRWGERTRYWKNEIVRDDLYFLKEGDIVISMDGSKVGKNYVLVKNNDLPLLLHQRMCRIKLSNKALSKYVCYYIGSEMFRYYIDVSKTDPMIPHITQKDIFNFPLGIPGSGEILKIVQFLDEKTEIIDKLISTKERKIELLKQQRTSLINQVITKGLDPNVKMKDSGVDWIGEIPVHWESSALKYTVKSNEKSLDEITDPNYELNYIEIGDVDSSGNINNSTPYLFKNAPSRCRRILTRGDVFVSTVRTYLKAIGYIQDEVRDLICSTGFCVLSPNETIISKYLLYQILTEYFIGKVISKSEGVSYPSITATELIKIKIFVPPIVEQQQIVVYLDKHTKEIDDLITLEQKKIDLLKEYRQSLISEVITGKIDVRFN